MFRSWPAFRSTSRQSLTLASMKEGGCTRGKERVSNGRRVISLCRLLDQKYHPYINVKMISQLLGNANKTITAIIGIIPFQRRTWYTIVEILLMYFIKKTPFLSSVLYREKMCIRIFKYLVSVLETNVLNLQFSNPIQVRLKIIRIFFILKDRTHLHAPDVRIRRVNTTFHRRMSQFLIEEIVAGCPQYSLWQEFVRRAYARVEFKKLTSLPVLMSLHYSRVISLSILTGTSQQHVKRL